MSWCTISFFFFLYTSPPSHASNRPYTQNLSDQHSRAGWNVSSIVIMPTMWHKILNYIQPRFTKLILCKNEPQMAIITTTFTVTSSTCLGPVQSGTAVTTVMFSLCCWSLPSVAFALMLTVQSGNALKMTELLWNWALSYASKILKNAHVQTVDPHGSKLHKWHFTPGIEGTLLRQLPNTASTCEPCIDNQQPKQWKAQRSISETLNH